MNYTAEMLGLLKLLMETPEGTLILFATLAIGLMLSFLPYFRVLRTVFPKVKVFRKPASKHGQSLIINEMEKTISSLLKENKAIREELRDLHNQCVAERTESRRRYNEMEDELRSLRSQIDTPMLSK